MSWFDKVKALVRKEEKRKEETLEELISEVLADNTPEKVEKQDITSGSTIHVKQVERNRLGFDHWAKLASGLYDDGCVVSEYLAEQVVIQDSRRYPKFDYLENMVKLLVNLAGNPEGSCCRFYRKVVEKDGFFFVQVRLYVWHNLKTPPPKVLRDGAAIKLTNRGKTYDYVCKGESYHPSEGEEV